MQFRRLGHVCRQTEMLTGSVPAGATRSMVAGRHAGAATLAIIVVLSLALAACGGSQKKHSAGGSETTRTSTTTTRAVAAPKPIATVDDTTVGLNQPDRMQLSIYDLRRDGSFLVLDFGIRCLTPSSGCSLVDAFAPGYEEVGLMARNAWTPAGIRVIDPNDLKEYLPVRDADQRPYASYFAQGDSGLTDSLIHLEWVRYPLPPTGVSALDVVFPDGGPVVSNVPVSSGAGPTAGPQIQPAQPAPFAQSASATSTAGLSLPVENLIATSGNPIGSDSESAGRAQLTLQSDVLFRFDKSNLTPEAQTVLRSVAQEIKTRARGTVQVTGYTDSIGTDAVNIPLSQARAHTVVAALTPLTPGINYGSRGLGPADPVAPNTKPDGSDNPAGRALNRRVTIVFSAAPARPAPPASSGPSAGPAAQAASMTFLANWAGGNDTYRVSDPALARDGNLLVLTMTLTCAASKTDNTCVPIYDLAGLPTVPPQPVYANGPTGLTGGAVRSISGFSLIDPTTGTEYIPVRRTDTMPLTSNIAESLPAGDGYRMWIYFAAPPSSTTDLTLVSPGGKGRLGPIPISAGAPAAP